MMPVPIADPRAFVAANTRLTPVPHVPEIMLHVADEPVPSATSGSASLAGGRAEPVLI